MNLSDYIEEIRCPYCYSFVSINQTYEISKIILFCENCGKIDFFIEQYNSLMNQQKIKSCNNCCKNFSIKEMIYNQKKKLFLCKKCFMYKKNLQEINIEDYIYFSDIGKNCSIHKNIQKYFFCRNCKKHICSECLKENSHSQHYIINICEEAKKKNNIEEMKKAIKNEENEIELEQEFGDQLLKAMREMFEKDLENRNNILLLKKNYYDYFRNNINDYHAIKNADYLINTINNSELFINDSQLNEITSLLNELDLNNMNLNDNNKENNSKKSLNKNIQIKNKEPIKIKTIGDDKIPERARSEIKTTSKLRTFSNNAPQNYDIYKMPNIYLQNNNSYNINESKKLFVVSSPIKFKQNIKFKNNRNDKIISRQNEKIDNILFAKKFDGKILSILFIESNKILVSILSKKENLFLIEITKAKSKNNINLNIISSINTGDNPFVHMEMINKGNILSYSNQEIFITKIKNNIIHTKNIILNHNNDITKPFPNHINLEIISCISLEKENFFLFFNIHNKRSFLSKINDIIFSKNNKPFKWDFNSNNFSEFKEFKIFSVQKISNSIFVVLGNKNDLIYKTIITLKFYKLSEKKLSFINETDFDLNEREKPEIMIKKIDDNNAIITDQINGFIIYNFQKDIISSIYKYHKEKIISMDIKYINNQIFLYTLEYKESFLNNFNPTLIRKYLIKKIKTDFSVKLINSTELRNNSFLKSNKMKDLLVIYDFDKNEKEKKRKNMNLILINDDIGNLYYVLD